LSRYPPSFYRDDPVEVAQRLLGGLLVHHHVDGDRIGRIVETEAYRGEEDRACHASKGRTARTEVMYGPPGHAYVYLIYGMYDLLNVVTWPEGEPAAVLIRALEPVQGLSGRTDGPGRLTRAMGIDRSFNRADFSTGLLSLRPDREVGPEQIVATPRIGVDYAGDWAQRPWRFHIRENPHVSRTPRPRPKAGAPTKAPSGG